MAAKGLDRLKRQLKALPKLSAEAAIGALQAGSKDVIEAVRRAAPYRRGALRRSIRLELGGQIDGQRTFGAVKGANVRIVAGDDEAYYARWVEHGTAYARSGRFRDASGKRRNNKRPHRATRAQPFFYVTIRAYRRSLRNRITRAANKAAKACAAVR